MLQRFARQMMRGLTAQRKTILEIILLSTTPIGAYEVLEQLCRSVGKQIAPMTVYRAIDFLIEQRLIHRIASLNAYVACDHPEHSHNSLFFHLYRLWADSRVA